MNNLYFKGSLNNEWVDHDQFIEDNLATLEELFIKAGMFVKADNADEKRDLQATLAAIASFYELDLVPENIPLPLQDEDRKYLDPWIEIMIVFGILFELKKKGLLREGPKGTFELTPEGKEIAKLLSDEKGI